MPKNISALNDSPRPWTSFADADLNPPIFYGVTVTAEHFHMPVGADRDAIFFNASATALGAIFAGCNALSLSTYRGGQSSRNYSVTDMIGARPVVSDSIWRTQKAPPARFARSTFEDLEGYSEPVTILDVMINSDEAQLHIKAMDKSLTDPKAWAVFSNKVVELILMKCVQTGPGDKRRAMKKLVRYNDFITA